jgi:hypothetical protein
MTTWPTQSGWIRIFKELPIQDRLRSQDAADVTASQISRYSGRESSLTEVDPLI